MTAIPIHIDDSPEPPAIRAARLPAPPLRLVLVRRTLRTRVYRQEIP